jgi:hypothetical protein
MIRRWLSGMAIGLILGCCSLAASNYVLDPYGVLRQRDVITNFHNQGYKKIEYLKNHQGEFDGLILGSSRISGLDVSKIGYGKYYNFSLPMAEPEAELLNLKYIHENINPIKHVFLGVDTERMYFNQDDFEDDLFSQLHPDVEDHNRHLFYLGYFMHLPNRNDLKNFWLNGPPPIYIQMQSMIKSDGSSICYTCGEALNKRPEDHLKYHKRKASLYLRPLHQSVEASVNEVALLIDYMKEHNIRYTVFVTPKYASTYRFVDFDVYFEFKKKLSHITPYLDFDQLNIYTKDRYMFHDIRHVSQEYSSHISEYLVKFYTGYPDTFSNDRFAHYVDAKNVDSYLKNQRDDNTTYAKSLR